MWMLSFLVLFFVQSTLSEICPAREDISPCYCAVYQNSINVHCSHLESLKQLTDSVSNLRGRRISTFVIKNSHIEYIPYNLFENVTIKELEISQSNISRISNLGEPQFKGLENSLESIKLLKTFDRKNPLAYISVEHLNRLTNLEIRDNYVEHICNHMFKNGPKSLRIVRFVKGDIQRMGHHAFTSLTNLKIIDLSGNDLSYIPRWALPEPATFLEELNLERNKFESLPEDIFIDMPNLKRVNLELNEFSTLDEKIWRPVWTHLELINIDYNPMVCDQKIKWIYESKEDLEKKLIATCYKPFKIMERDLHSLKLDELGKTG